MIKLDFRDGPLRSKVLFFFNRQCQCRVETEEWYKQSACLILTILYLQYFDNPSLFWQLYIILTGTILTLFWQSYTILTNHHWFDMTYSFIVLTCTYNARLDSNHALRNSPTHCFDRIIKNNQMFEHKILALSIQYGIHYVKTKIGQKIELYF